MQEIAAAYPAIVQMVDLTATYGTPATFEGRHMFALKISDNVAVDEDEPAMLIVANHHAREIVTPVIALDAAERLTVGYEADPRIAAAVDSHEIWIAPTWNPTATTTCSPPTTCGERTGEYSRPASASTRTGTTRRGGRRAAPAAPPCRPTPTKDPARDRKRKRGR
jgi:carboxypeptidase T